MYGHEKSAPAIVAVKSTNNAEQSVAEPVEQRAGTKGNAGQQSYRQRTTDDAGALIIQRKNS
jgi:hypothetical protein